ARPAGKRASASGGTPRRRPRRRGRARRRRSMRRWSRRPPPSSRRSSRRRRPRWRHRRSRKQRASRKPRPSQSPSSPPEPPLSSALVRRTGQKLLKFDRNLGARLVAGTDEAGRGSLAGPLVVAGVLLDYDCLRDHKVRPLGLLNDSKQCTAEQREELFRGVLGCAERIEVRMIPQGEIDRKGLHRSNLAAMRSILRSLSPPAEVCLVDGFKLGPTAPPHRAVVDGDEKSAAIAAASIVAEVTRGRLLR